MFTWGRTDYLNTDFIHDCPYLFESVVISTSASPHIEG